MKKIFLNILIALLSFGAVAQTPRDVEFKSDKSLDSIHEKSLKSVKISRENGTPCLSVGADAGTITFNAVKLEPKTKYKLTLRAYTARPDCIESNERALEFATTSSRLFPEYSINCFDRNGEAQTLMLYGKIRIGYSAPVISRKAADYVYVFYTPDSTTEMRLELRTNSNKLFIERFRLEKEKDEKTVNCNPDFRYGPLNPNGWQSQTVFFNVPGSGRTVAQCGYFNSSPFFLVDEHNSYSYYCKGVEAAPGKATITVSFFDVKGIKTGGTHLFHGNEVKNGASRNALKPPPGTFQAQFVVTNMILSELKVTKD